MCPSRMGWTSLSVSSDGKWPVFGRRDSAVLIWDISSRVSPVNKRTKKKAEFSPVLHKTIHMHERVEAVGLLRPDEDLAGASSGPGRFRFYTGGEKGLVIVWDAREGNVPFTLG